MKQVSNCCLKPILVDWKREYPLGGRNWYQTYKVDVCEGCGKEVEESVNVHECCGVEICECVTAG